MILNKNSTSAVINSQANLPIICFLIIIMVIQSESAFKKDEKEVTIKTTNEQSNSHNKDRIIGGDIIIKLEEKEEAVDPIIYSDDEDVMITKETAKINETNNPIKQHTKERNFHDKKQYVFNRKILNRQLELKHDHHHHRDKIWENKNIKNTKRNSHIFGITSKRSNAYNAHHSKSNRYEGSHLSMHNHHKNKLLSNRHRKKINTYGSSRNFNDNSPMSSKSFTNDNHIPPYIKKYNRRNKQLLNLLEGSVPPPTSKTHYIQSHSQRNHHKNKKNIIDDDIFKDQRHYHHHQNYDHIIKLSSDDSLNEIPEDLQKSIIDSNQYYVDFQDNIYDETASDGTKSKKFLYHRVAIPKLVGAGSFGLIRKQRLPFVAITDKRLRTS